jgi:hypothetical protein
VKPLVGILHATIAAATVRKTEAGKEFLSIKAEPITDKPAAEPPLPVWITTFHKTHIAAGILEGMRVRAEGPLRPHYYTKDGAQRCTLHLDVVDKEKLTFMVEVDAGPLACAQPAGVKVAGRSTRTKASASTPAGSLRALVPSDGSAIIASPSKGKWTAEELALLAGPGKASAKYGNGVDWKQGDDIRDLF